VLRRPQFPQHLFGVDETTVFDILLRLGQRSMEGSPVIRLYPVAWIEREETDLSPFRKLRRFLHHESTILNAGFEGHTKRIAWSLRQSCQRESLTVPPPSLRIGTMATNPESTTLQTEVPVRLLAELQSLVDAGWFHSVDELILDALRRFLDSHREDLMRGLIREDVEWGLRGTD